MKHRPGWERVSAGHRPLRVRRAAGILALAVVVVACAPVAGVEYDDPATPPPGAAPALGPFEVVAADGLPDAAGQLVSVAAGEPGAVAIGTLEEAGQPEALMLFSADGSRWERVGVGPGFTLTDVASGPGGFVAVGTRSADGGQERTAIVISADGRTWEVLPDDARDGADAYLGWVAAGPGGLRAGGSWMGDAGGAVSWWSIDGRQWHLDDTSVTSAVAAGPAWLESRDAMLRIAPGEAGTGDGIPWSKVEEPPGDPTIIQLGPGAAGTQAVLALGAVGGPCRPLGSCAAEQRAWVSTDGATWRLLPSGSPGAPPPYVDQVAIGRDGELLALGYEALHASLDGWHWAALGTPGAAGIAWADVAPLRDGYLVVGTREAAGIGPVPLIELLRPVAP
jgi:hypothetical protein